MISGYNDHAYPCPNNCGCGNEEFDEHTFTLEESAENSLNNYVQRKKKAK
jgi:hypothetical protein